MSLNPSIWTTAVYSTTLELGSVTETILVPGEGAFTLNWTDSSSSSNGRDAWLAESCKTVNVIDSEGIWT